ncbi:uncharacterized protein EV422DRAFT_528576 [Fimicolochytrium jonesii]|uniref:uncharacterized protein n=1 Tax=Fimicolochytrium jonesii TaxID=1396493 RepID=UPI0022FDB22F|nr:uncharacterized protein EV422DRAFT_528576 [Fimicolochytrium jonesii]KAI8820965.1 hypothetical protein EV422DRAFT_528576 [Fimicolochytrium jonesii]
MTAVAENPRSPDEFLSEYLESAIGNLPSELAFNMSVLRDLDVKFHSMVESMRHNSRSYSAIMKQRRTAGSAEGAPVIIGADKDARGALVGYRQDYKMAVEQADRKLEASQRVLDQFTSHYSRLEKALHQFEEEEAARHSHSTSTRKRKRTTSETDSHIIGVTPSRRRIRQKSESVALEVPQTIPEVAVGVATLGMKTGTSEDEEVYCICQQVSHGDMVACDNQGCAIEWFHYACVGLTTPPKGSWYCTTCLSQGIGRNHPTLPTPAPDEIIDVEGDEDVKFMVDSAIASPVSSLGEEGRGSGRKDTAAAVRRRKKMEARERGGV